MTRHTFQRCYIRVATRQRVSGLLQAMKDEMDKDLDGAIGDEETAAKGFELCFFSLRVRTDFVLTLRKKRFERFF